jgi:hypothetical protein
MGHAAGRCTDYRQAAGPEKIGPIKNNLEESMELGAAVLMIFILLAFSPLLKKLFARSQQTPAKRVL